MKNLSQGKKNRSQGTKNLCQGTKNLSQSNLVNLIYSKFLIWSGFFPHPRVTDIWIIQNYFGVN